STTHHAPSILVSAYAFDSCRSRAPRRGGGRSCTYRKSVSLTHVLSSGPQSSRRQILNPRFLDSNDLTHDSSAPTVDRRQFNFDPIAHEHANEIAIDPIRNMRRHLRSTVEPHPIRPLS